MDNRAAQAGSYWTVEANLAISNYQPKAQGHRPAQRNDQEPGAIRFNSFQPHPRLKHQVSMLEPGKAALVQKISETPTFTRMHMSTVSAAAANTAAAVTSETSAAITMVPQPPQDHSATARGEWMGVNLWRFKLQNLDAGSFFVLTVLQEG